MDTFAALPAVPDQPESPQGWGPRFRMPLYRPGTRVRHAGSWETVSHVALRRNGLAVYLVGNTDPVNPLELELEPTVFTTERMAQALRAAGCSPTVRHRNLGSRAADTIERDRR